MLGNPVEPGSAAALVLKSKGACDVVQALNAEGIAVRAGSLAAEPPLIALGVEETVCASFMFYNTPEEAES
jgi:cysteine desulfurase/selenocysteine lyase